MSINDLRRECEAELEKQDQPVSWQNLLTVALCLLEFERELVQVLQECPEYDITTQRARAAIRCDDGEKR